MLNFVKGRPFIKCLNLSETIAKLNLNNNQWNFHISSNVLAFIMRHQTKICIFYGHIYMRAESTMHATISRSAKSKIECRAVATKPEHGLKSNSYLIRFHLMRFRKILIFSITCPASTHTSRHRAARWPNRYVQILIPKKINVILMEVFSFKSISSSYILAVRFIFSVVVCVWEICYGKPGHFVMRVCCCHRLADRVVGCRMLE